MKTIDVRTKRKLNRIMEAAKKSGRRMFYEEFYDFNGKFYTVFYR